MRALHLAVLVLVMLLAGCDPQAWMDRITPKDASEQARTFVAQVAARDFEGAETKLADELREPDTRAKLEAVANVFPPGAPTTVRLVGVNARTQGDNGTYSLTFEYSYPQRWILANVVMQRQQGRLSVVSMHVNPLAASLEQTNRFTFVDKGIRHILFFVLALAIPLLILYALVACIRTQMARRKWLWIVFILFGVGQFTLNWSDGSMQMRLLSVELFGAGFMRPGVVGPYILSVGLPLGALVFLWKYRMRGRGGPLPAPSQGS